ncbi:hypothetical protein C8Q80DRAFT_1180364 [Daedaleopsis nitida]|nr:hypothetical protein C8Q80DRAFT_1180364 [Daedaleopsis nitida]
MYASKIIAILAVVAAAGAVQGQGKLSIQLLPCIAIVLLTDGMVRQMSTTRTPLSAPTPLRLLQHPRRPRRTSRR